MKLTNTMWNFNVAEYNFECYYLKYYQKYYQKCCYNVNIYQSDCQVSLARSCNTGRLSGL